MQSRKFTFILGILCSLAIVAVVVFLPVFPSNMPISMIFDTSGQIAPTNVGLTGSPGEGMDLSPYSMDSNSYHGTSIYGYHGSVTITVYENYNHQQFDLTIPSVSIYDMIVHNLWHVGFSWDSGTQKWIQEYSISFLD